MYKRAARILFVESAPATRARLAEAAAKRIGDSWLEGRAASLDVRDSSTPVGETGLRVSADGVYPPLSCDLLEWADLVVLLDAACERYCAAFSPGRRRKRWFLSARERTDPVDEGAAAEIEARVASMVGGLRMLARSDAADDEEDSSNQEAED